MADAYVKTEAGRREIRERATALTRPGRNLLLIIDASKSGAEWLGLVQGGTADDLARLIDAGLVARQPAGAGARAAAVGAAAAGQPASANAGRASLAQQLASLPYRQLYDLITSQARPRLGLIKGYKMVLEVERCNGPAEIRVLTARFIEMVREVQGDAEAQALLRMLSAPP